MKKSGISRRKILKTGLGLATAATVSTGRAAIGRNEYDCIVVGLGAFGSGALYWLSRRLGRRVLGIEQFELGHHNGSGQDHSRATHYQYSDPVLIQLGVEAIKTWKELEQETGERIYIQTGGVDFVERGSQWEAGFDKAKQQVANAGLPVEEWAHQECMRNYDQFRVTENVRTVFYPETGIADANKGNATHIAAAKRNGAGILTQTPIRDIRLTGGEVEVTTEKGVYRAAKLVLVSGAWGQRWLQKLGLDLPLKVYQQQVTYFKTAQTERFGIGKFPIFHLSGEGHPYGFPVYGEMATKAGIDAFKIPVDADKRDFLLDKEAENDLSEWVNKWIPGYARDVLYSKSCLLTFPEDRLCMLDQVPGMSQVSFAVGAGMSYKFSSLFGKIMSELAIDNKTSYNFSAIQLSRLT